MSLTERMRLQLDNLGFTEAADGQSYFFFNQKLRAFVEVSSYSRVVQEAVKRNQAFFDKLGLRTGTRGM